MFKLIIHGTSESVTASFDTFSDACRFRAMADALGMHYTAA